VSPKSAIYDTLIVWIRRELRIHDHLALRAAASDAKSIVPLFILEDQLEHAAPGRKEVIVNSLEELRNAFRRKGGELFIRAGEPHAVLHKLLTESGANGVYLTREFDPELRSRDLKIRSSVEGIGKSWKEFNDHVLFDVQEILTKSERRPFTVFSAYQRAWKEKEQHIPPPLPAIKEFHTPRLPAGEIPQLRGNRRAAGSLDVTGGESNGFNVLGNFLRKSVGIYQERRDFPAVHGTSRLSHHLSAGTLSIRTVYHRLRQESASRRGREKLGVDGFLSELIWREFYYQILANFPHVVHCSFNSKYDDLEWSSNDEHFERWSKGLTGVPIVDASMRQLNTTGWMHNRGRMIVANFLTKDLHIDWRRGEAYFMKHLVDGDLALNNGGWQWCAGTGNDAQPWFRIFNPVLQSKKFDPKGEFIRRYVPELEHVPDKYIHDPWLMPASFQKQSGCQVGKTYPKPVVDHDVERKRALALYAGVSKLQQAIRT